MASESLAERKELPEQYVFSVEYPGYVENTDKAIASLGGHEKLARDFTEEVGLPVELRYRYDDPVSHPINGEVVATQNLLLKVKRRVRKPRNGTEQQNNEVKTTVEAVGVIDKTVRFRKLADFQYIYPKSDPIVQFSKTLRDLDIEGIKKLASSDILDKGLDATASYIPGPFFDDQGWPTQYRYRTGDKEAPANVQEELGTAADTTPHEKVLKRTKNKARFHGISVSFYADQVPAEPSPEAQKDRKHLPQELVKMAEDLLEEMPVISRNAMEVLMPASVRGTLRLNVIMPTVSYIMDAGPWRSCWIRFGYDPRKESGSYKYQVVDMRRLAGKTAIDRRRTPRGTQQTQQQDRAPRNAVEANSYIFDEELARQGIAGVFQIMHVQIPLIQSLIDYPGGMRRTPCERSGWFRMPLMAAIRTEIRRIQKRHEDSGHLPKEKPLDYAELDKLIEEDKLNDTAQLAIGQMLQDREESTQNAGQASQAAKERVDKRVEEYMRMLSVDNDAENDDDNYASDFGDFGIFGDGAGDDEYED
ncbi:hypothetical protein GQ54DRAFT_6627 [Martensiomyces pterosporus]|nr:hypothetical protein GQ54DRAFT_6627 [Martensiomyces pterosporus]